MCRKKYSFTSFSNIWKRCFLLFTLSACLERHIFVLPRIYHFLPWDSIWIIQKLFARKNIVLEHTSKNFIPRLEIEITVHVIWMLQLCLFMPSIYYVQQVFDISLISYYHASIIKCSKIYWAISSRIIKKNYTHLCRKHA